MNKLTLAAVAAICASASFGEITSDVVGYNSVDLTANVSAMITTTFDGIEGSGEGIMIKDLVKGNIPYGMEMQVRKPTGGYDYYTYLEEALDLDTDEFVPGWADGYEELATTKLAPGAAFWLRTKSSCSVSVAGQLLADSSKKMTYNANVSSMVGNPYPADVNPNELEWEGLPYGTEMQVRKPNGGYDYYTYLEEALDLDTDKFVPGWADGYEELVKIKILKAGYGAWIVKPANAITINWKSPIQ